MTAPFADRRDAGRRLAAELTSYADRDDLVVLGIPRGGVPVAYEVARALGAPLDALVVRKLGAPGQEELAFGAIAPGSIRVLVDPVLDALGLTDAQIGPVVAREGAELQRRERAYRGDREPLRGAGRTAIVVDDGLATGATMRAAVAALRALRATAIVVAVPVAAATTCAALRPQVDALVCVGTLEHLGAVGRWYDDFRPTSDDDVRRLLSDP